MDEQAAVTPASVLRRFLSIVEPALVCHLPAEDQSCGSPNQKTDTVESTQHSDLALSEWELLYASHPAIASFQPADLAHSTEHIIVVRTHPDPAKPLFSIQAYLPNLSARQFWTLMAESENRKLWDGSIQTVEITPLEQDRLTATCGSNARLEVLSFGAIFMVTAKRDMVLISVDAQLPPRAYSDQASESRRETPLRLMSASQSVVHPAFPPRKKFSRFDLGIGGFLVEDLSRSDGSGNGIMITQISDLGPAATWLPASIIKMVASTMVPRSIVKIAERARQTIVPPELCAEKGASRGNSSPDLDDNSARHMRPIGPYGEVWELGRRLPALIVDPQRVNARPVRSSSVAHIKSDSSDVTPVSSTPKHPSAAMSWVEESAPVWLEADTSAVGKNPTSQLRASRHSVGTARSTRRSPSSHRISIVDCKRPASQLLCSNETIQEDTLIPESGSPADEKEDEVSIRLADALSDELDRIILETVKTMRMNSDLKRSTANTASTLRSSAFYTASSLPTGLPNEVEFASQTSTLEPRLPSGSAEAGDRRSRRAASRKLLDASDVCSMLLAPAAYDTPTSTRPDENHDRDLAQETVTAESLKRQSLILDACHAEAADLVRATGLVEDEKADDAKKPESSVAAGSYWSSWWPSFGLLRGVFPVISWESH